MIGLRNYAIVTAAYWAFTLTDGALRMLVLLHFNQLGYSPVAIAFLFLASFIADPLARTVLQQAANLVASVVWAPVQWGTFTVLYYDTRVRREAYDLSLAAEALTRGS